jgi:hypothetical protein
MNVRLIIFFCIGFSPATIPLSAQDNEGFMLVKKEGSISIYERWLTFPASNPPIPAREVKGEFFYNSSAYNGFRLLQNESKIKAWQNHVSEFKIYPQRDTTTWLEYSYHDIPWPVSDQDHFMEYRVVSSSHRNLVISFASKVNDTLAPVRKGVTRMELSGSWTFQQVGPGRVKATYRIFSKPIGIPRVFTDPIIRSNIMTTIGEYIALLEGRATTTP